MTVKVVSGGTILHNSMPLKSLYLRYTVLPETFVGETNVAVLLSLSFISQSYGGGIGI